MPLVFKEIKSEDFILIRKWFKNPHVKEVWENEEFEEPYEEYIFRTSDETIKQFILYYNSTPIGYFQFYWASKVGNNWWPGIDPETVGIDFYIGETSFLGRGIGTLIILNALEFLFKDKSINRIIADPSPNNLKIIHLLTKCGFQSKGEINTPDGKAILMELKR